jgi:hypothetical protein
VNILITSTESPIQRYFKKCFEQIVIINGSKETITLWHLPATPPLGNLFAALQWIEPLFRDTIGHPFILQQIQRLHEMANGEALSGHVEPK